MNRRSLILKGSSGLALLAFTSMTRAEDPPRDEIQMSTEISINHGHEFLISAAGALAALRATATQPDLSLAIQGKAGHDHQIQLSHEVLLKLFIQGEITVPSTTDLHHAHEVTIKMSTV